MRDKSKEALEDTGGMGSLEVHEEGQFGQWSLVARENGRMTNGFTDSKRISRSYCSEKLKSTPVLALMPDL